MSAAIKNIQTNIATAVASVNDIGRFRNINQTQDHHPLSSHPNLPELREGIHERHVV